MHAKILHSHPLLKGNCRRLTRFLFRDGNAFSNPTPGERSGFPMAIAFTTLH
jgi:hypothetical protein